MTEEPQATDGEPAHSDGLPARVAAELRRWTIEPLAAGLHIVATPIGNLGDITVRGLATLARADLICCEDTRHSRSLLSHYGISRPTRALHDHNEDAESARLVSMIGQGRAIALISDAGTPLISDPGYRLARAVIVAGHAVHALPGASAILAGLTVSGLPTDSFLFAGFLPVKDGARRERLASLLATPATLVLYEAPGRVVDLLGELERLAGDRAVVLARELTKRFEAVRRGTPSALLASLGEHDHKGEFVVMVAPPGPREITEDVIQSALDTALASMSLRDAARAVADALGVPRSRVYDLGLKQRARDE
ncbi:MAG: 16S rRNA (cytidine(1402)-2'-O)-methyltransferase [Hyphomicrobiaceae bacterium]